MAVAESGVSNRSQACLPGATKGLAPGKEKELEEKEKATRRARSNLTADLESQSLKVCNSAPGRARADLNADLERYHFYEWSTSCHWGKW